jgi:hypothetical protein
MFFLETGTVHIGGIIVAEIQQTSLPIVMYD